MDLYADLLQIYDYGAEIATPGRRIVAVNFIDKVLFAHPDAPLLYWTGAGDAKIVPGLPPDEYYRGVNVFQNYVILWKGNRLKWSSPNDFTEWIPVGSTATSFVFKLASPFVRGENGEVSGGYMYVNRSPLGLVAGQFLRIDSPPFYDFFEVDSVLPSTEMIGSVSGFTQTILPGASATLFLSSFVPYTKGAKLFFDGSDATLEVQENAKDAGSSSLVLSEVFSVPASGNTVDVTVASMPSITAGTYVSVGPTLFPGQDIYYVEAVDYKNNILSLRRTGISLSNSLDHQPGEYVVPQFYIRVKNVSTLTATGGFLTKLKERWGFKVKPIALTGQSASSYTFPVGKEVFTIDANGAGEAINGGSDVNGEILAVVTISDYAYILKHRSIQSMQYVGQDQGTFFIRPEVSDEGLLGAYSFVKVGNDKIYFWGNREIYEFAGGNQLVPVGQQHTKQAFAELDKGKANQIIGYHNEKDSEVWFIYPRKDQPAKGPLRVLIYNYLENSCTIDDYDTDLQAISAAGRIEWSREVIWNRAGGTWETPTSWVAEATWADISADVNEAFSILGVKNQTSVFNGPGLLVHGEGTYNRLGEAYESIWETVDYDGGDSVTWKYIDTVFVSLQVKAALTPPKYLEIYVGTKKDYDDDISWSAPKTVDVSGNRNFTTKVNIQKAGKYVRLRIRSVAADIQWRISQMRILGRTGGEY